MSALSWRARVGPKKACLSCASPRGSPPARLISSRCRKNHCCFALYERYLKYKQHPSRPGILARSRAALISTVHATSFVDRTPLRDITQRVGLLPWLIYVVVLGILLLPILLVIVALRAVARLFLASAEQARGIVRNCTKPAQAPNSGHATKGRSAGAASLPIHGAA